MGRFVTYILLLAIVLPVVATAKTVEPGGGAGASPPTAPVAPPAGATPALRALRLVPLTVQGLHFTARERVVLTVFSTDAVARRKTAIAAPNGSFTISFGNEQGSRCDTLVHAVGSRGNRARLKLLPRPACLTV
jgi:hypothetical protein